MNYHNNILSQIKMPKKNKARKNGSNKPGGLNQVQQLILPEDMQDFALVVKALGDRNFTIKHSEGTCIGRVRGKMRNRQRVKEGDVVLMCKRDTNDGKIADIVHIYPPDQVRQLRKDGLVFIDETSSDNLNRIDESLAEEAFDFNDI